ncbi:uncharacterized protein LOC129611659 [Condylostylus longicornis]|uniref:uncharacterized protein LOC129611659 n=1 Tax=Condylostylus longicornis TaxID=2530218 RepID=UPI00244DC168|nr:uncharacterized protein LOC129611659 [Condylostylus longicornis]
MKNAMLYSMTTPNSVIMDVTFRMSVEERSRLPSEESVKKALRRPFNSHYKKNSSGMPEDLVQHILYDSGVSEANRILIFAHEEMAAGLESADIWMADGIFAVAPQPFFKMTSLPPGSRNFKRHKSMKIYMSDILTDR